MSIRLSTVGNVLVVAGSMVGVATVAAVATGAEIHLSQEMIQLLIYKGLAAAAVGLIVVGSWIGRRGRKQERDPGIVADTKKDLLSGVGHSYEKQSGRRELIHEDAEQSRKE